MEQDFELLADGMITRVEVFYRKVKETKKSIDEPIRLLIDRAIHFFGLWNPDSTGSKRHSSITEFKREFGLFNDVDILRVPWSGVSKISKRLETLGYEYEKGKCVFGPKWNGVKQ